MKKLLERRETSVFLILAVLCIGLTIYSPAFLSYTNIKNVLVSNTALGIMAAGMTFILITAGIDVSVASQMMFSATWLALLAETPAGNPVTLVLAALVIGLFTGAVNGFLISRYNIHPIIITLGTNSIYRGTILVITNGRWLMNLPKYFTAFSKTVFGIPLPVVYALVIFLVSGYLLKHTYFGRSIYAMGGNHLEYGEKTENHGK